MAQTAPYEETHIVDSLLHNNWKRVFFGGVCGILSGLLLLFLSTFIRPVGTNTVWFLQLMATFCHGGDALAFAAPSAVIMSGAIFHFTLSLINGLVFGKMTKSHSPKRLAGYGLVLGGLCWLASNMFAPDFVSIQGLANLGQWMRVFLFVSFGVSLGLFMSLASKVFSL